MKIQRKVHVSSLSLDELMNSHLLTDQCHPTLVIWIKTIRQRLIENSISLLRKLIFFSKTRPDVASAVNKMATRAVKHPKKDYSALLRIGSYLVSTSHLGMCFQQIIQEKCLVLWTQLMLSSRFKITDWVCILSGRSSQCLQCFIHEL